MSEQPAGSSTVRPHPLEPLTAEEIRAAVAGVRATGKLSDAARSRRSCSMSHRRRRSPRSATISRRIDRPCWWCPVRTLGRGSARQHGHAAMSSRWVERDDVRPALAVRGVVNAIIALHEHAASGPRSRSAGISTSTGPDRPVADRQLRDRGRRAGASPAASRTTARSRPTTATPDRSRGCSPSSTWRAARCSRSSTTAWCRCPTAAAATCPRTTAAAA